MFDDVGFAREFGEEHRQEGWARDVDERRTANHGANSWRAGPRRRTTAEWEMIDRQGRQPASALQL